MKCRTWLPTSFSPEVSTRQNASTMSNYHVKEIKKGRNDQRKQMAVLAFLMILVSGIQVCLTPLLPFRVIPNAARNNSEPAPSDVSPNTPSDQTHAGTDKKDVIVASSASFQNMRSFDSTSRTLLNFSRNEVIEPSREPVFVLHVGPPKTGSTSLQHVLHAYEQLLIEDSYYYLGNAKTMGGHFTQCMRKMEKFDNKENRKCWDTFTGLLEYHRNLGHNIIMSNEVIGLHVLRPFPWRLIHEHLGNWSRVEIIVSYRHLHNFVPSAHFELQKNLRWPGPPENGKFVKSFPSFWKAGCNRSIVGSMPTPGALRAHFEAANYSVKMLDIEGQDQISHFLCVILDDANRTCAFHSTNSTLHTPELNQRDDGQLNYDSLGLVAWENHRFKTEQSRPYVRGKIKRFQEVYSGLSANDFPLDCLDSEQENRLLEESFQHARDCGIDVTGAAREMLQSDFVRAKEEKKFCTINATVAFAESKWQEFFAGAKTIW